VEDGAHILPNEQLHRRTGLPGLRNRILERMSMQLVEEGWGLDKWVGDMGVTFGILIGKGILGRMSSIINGGSGG
jgi:hypothetical protein